MCAQVFGVPISGTLVQEPWTTDGSGSTYLWGYLDSVYRCRGYPLSALPLSARCMPCVVRTMCNLHCMVASVSGPSPSTSSRKVSRQGLLRCEAGCSRHCKQCIPCARTGHARPRAVSGQALAPRSCD